MELNWSAFGEWVAEHRKRIHLTQTAAATKLGIDRQTWYRIEKGAATKLANVPKIAEIVRGDSQEALRLIQPELFELTAGKPEQTEKVEVELPISTTAQLDTLGTRWGVKRSAAGRELLLLGLAVFDAMNSGEVNLSRLAEGGEKAKRPASVGRVISD